jgi:hypothetical protein
MEREFAAFLRLRGISAIEYSSATTDTDLKGVDAWIVGREHWMEQELDELIDSREGQSLRIYSQEMFLTFLASRVDPFYAPLAVLDAFRRKHPALEFISQGWSGWVDTYVAPQRRSAGRFRVDFDFPVKEGPLHVMGYHVGNTGAPQTQRREVLARAFAERLPIVGPWEYMVEWGDPSSGERLKKMADSIATFCRNMKRQGDAFRQAVADWESDLEWLKANYYHGHFRFQWPETAVY